MTQNTHAHITRSEATELKELVDIAREYVLAVRIKEAMGSETDPKRLMELNAYFTHCSLQVSPF